MQARYGRIINIASVSGLMGNPGQSNYSASKAGLIGMTRSVARELASRKVTVNAIAPGFIETEMTEALGESILAEVKARIPVRRLGTAEEIAAGRAVSGQFGGRYITGQVLDGRRGADGLALLARQGFADRRPAVESGNLRAGLRVAQIGPWKAEQSPRIYQFTGTLKTRYILTFLAETLYFVSA